jgi:hypothetical protein
MNETEEVERPATRGCDALREWLTLQGFTCLIDALKTQGSECNWYAYRRSKYPARECECNEGKPMQIVIRPFAYTAGMQSWESAEIDVTGEVHGLWYKLSAYSVPHADLMGRLSKIESKLVDAWNALSVSGEPLPVAKFAAA